jgi:inosine-uridine nucleoside N-ribohydrolase
MAALDPEIQIVGMSTSAGNTHIAYTTQNTLDILKFVNEKNVAVYQGL